ncbi:uncharacterized protein EKO05_0005045 [Ascochyta rabiei]|uniref:Uncharacterized protein n=1 Tax=Didymella rabiei TaxID=5454 RepID=A0A163BTT7_DIDRA|nr:uncharacterized protein EKO05_0005045 [Ascochyta rabiei]KZM21984.1 hypothetical protein ST47_g6864 [Ascochyta rabiei]UPX14567.1 hypothetical protein EKO05_0005045 [Ascochyta rabiei]
MADPTPSDYTYTPPTTSSPPPPSPGSANISIREYIYHLPHPLPAGTPVPYTPGLPLINPLQLPPHPFEPTSTLVLTTPGRWFIDIRYLKPQHPQESALPNRGETARLEWAFAGRSSSTVSPASPHATYGVVGHSVWTHWVDSRVRAGDEAELDEGDMYAVSASRTVECGVAFHPALGRVANHEEGWVDVSVRSAGAGARSKSSVLLRHENAATRSRGVVLRVGQLCQALLVDGDRVSTERWEFNRAGQSAVAGHGLDLDTTTTAAAGKENTWLRTARTGSSFLPCTATFRPQTLQVGGTVKCAGVEWVVEEVWEWV